MIVHIVSKNKANMIKMLEAVGGKANPSCLPRLNEKQDPMLSEPPPWGGESVNRVQLESCQYNKNENNNNLETNCDRENQSLDGQIPKPTPMMRLKICLSSILSRKNKNSSTVKERGSTGILSEQDEKQETHSFFKLNSEKLQMGFSNLLKKKRKQKKIHEKKSFVKVWLQDARGHSLKLYAFRKED